MLDLKDTIKLKVGDTAPDFTSLTQSGEQIILSKLSQSGQKVLLVFYPGDDTPGCTKQLCGIRDFYSEYQQLGVRVLGINHGKAKSHQKFIDKYEYKFDIIVDENKQIIHQYGALKKFFNNLAVKRGVFLVGSGGKISYIFWGQQDNEKIIELLKTGEI
jgi:thioredoxin-dependent peroxiredoxin